MRHRRRRKFSIWKWVPVVVALVLIVAAFVIAPSLQPPPPRTQSGSTITADLGHPLPPDSRPVDDRSVTRSPGGAPAPSAATTASRAEGTPDGASDRSQQAAASTRVRKRQRPAAGQRASPPPPAEEGADLNVRWNRANP